MNQETSEPRWSAIADRLIQHRYLCLGMAVVIGFFGWWGSRRSVDLFCNRNVCDLDRIANCNRELGIVGCGAGTKYIAGNRWWLPTLVYLIDRDDLIRS